MVKPTKEQLIEIVKSIMLEPKPEVINQILEDWNNLEDELKVLNKIDTTNIEPLSHIDEKPLIDFLREDEPNMNSSISKDNILSNAHQKDNDYVIVNDKVVK